MAHDDLDLKDYARMYATIHCQSGIPDAHNMMTHEVVTTILTQYHVSKGLKVLKDEGVKAVLVELKNYMTVWS